MDQNLLFVTGRRPPQLRGQKCTVCGRIAFPPNPYGCERCGAPAEMLSECLLEGRGNIRAVVTTTHANQRDIDVPYTVASVELVEGPVIRTLMAETSGTGLKRGQAVEAVLCETKSRSGAAKTEVRFERSQAS